MTTSEKPEKVHAERIRREMRAADKARARTAHYGQRWFEQFVSEPPDVIVRAFRRQLAREDFTAIADAFQKAVVNEIKQTCGD